MASLITVRISKGDSPNLGFRLQGGKDFGTPLVIQKVNVGSPAERAGLVAGDSVIKINNTDVFNLRHKDAQDVVVRAGPAFEITLQRGGSTWKPSVVPTGSFPTPSPVINNVSPVTRTSLTAPRGENIGAIGTGHNLSAKPFSPQVNGTVNGGPKIVNKQYNSPLKLYSEQSIAETLSAQTEVLSTGVLGVNFKKNEKNYDASNSAVLRMLKETENEPRTPDEEPESGVVTAPNSGIAGLRHVKAPETRPAPANPQLPPVVRSEYYSTQSHAIGGRKTVTPSITTVPLLDDHSRSSSVLGDPPRSNNPSEGVTVCTDCERVIVGVFVRIKDKNLHVECFKCSTCGTSLKNVGYYNISNKLYCDIHAKSAAIRINANPNLVPVTVPPGGKPPVQAISSALASHSLPSPSPLSPKLNNSFASPYQPQETKEVVDEPSSLPILSTNVTTEANNNNSLYNNSAPLSFSKYLNKSSTSYSGPKPFSSVSAPLSPASTLPRAAPLSPITPTAAPSYNAPSYNAPSYNAPSYKAPSYSPASSAGRSAQGIVWPPPQEEPELPTACPLFYPPPSQVEQIIFHKRVQKEAELESTWSECQEVEEINKMAQFLPKMSLCSEEVYNITERKSATECVETISETLETQQLVENILKTRPLSPPPIEADIQPSEPPKPTPKIDSVSQSFQTTLAENICYERRDSCELKRPTQFTPNTVECQLPSKIDNVVPQKWESPLTQVLRTTEPDPDTFAQIPSKHSASALASALAIAPALPFTPVFDAGKPVPLPEETVPYMPPEHPILPVEEKPSKESKPKQEKPKSQFVKALETAPERPFTPVGGSVTPVKKKPKDPTDKFFEELPRSQERISMLAALTTAPERPYSPLVVESVGAKQTEISVDAQYQRKDVDRSLLTKPLKPDVLPASFQMNKKEPKPPSYYSPSILYQRTEESKSEEHTEETNTSETRTIERQTIHNPQTTQIVVEDEQKSDQNFAPMFQAVSCYYQNKKDHFSIEISTTPPIPTPPPKPATPIIKTIETQPGYIEKETITEEKHARQQTTKKQEQVKEDIRAEIKTAKQAEEVILKRAAPPVQLHKPEGLPSYQVQLSESAEADLKLMEKMQKAQNRLDQQKISKSQAINEQQIVQQNQQIIQQQQLVCQGQQVKQQLQQSQQLEAPKKPIITIEPDTPQPRATFKPVSEDRPPSATFSPRPGSVTPSMINKPPSILPYYQLSLAPQHMRPVTASLLDPKSPGISRSPSPCLGARPRSPSPFPSGGSQRAVSPAPGPPENPLKSSQRLPTPRDSRLEQARENISTFIPEYKSKRDLIEHVQGMDYYERSREERDQQHVVQQQKQTGVTQTQRIGQPMQMYVSQVRTESFPLQQLKTREYESLVSDKQSLQSEKETYRAQKLDIEEAQRAERYTTRTAGGVVATAISEASQSAHLEQTSKSQSQSVQKSADGSRQVQRKTTVTEEYERCQKETNVQIEKNVTSTKKHPFREVNVPCVEASAPTSMHLTNPQPLCLTRGLGQISQQQTLQSSDIVCQLSSQQSSLQQAASSSTCKETCGKTTCAAQQLCSKMSQPAPCPTTTESQSRPPPPVKHVFAPSSIAPVKHVDPPGSSKKPNQNIIRPDVSQPNAGAGAGRQAGGISVTPKRGRGVLNTAAIGGARIPLCGHCNMQIRGPFITALGKIWCPNHFICTTASCRRPLQDLGFVEERGQLYCEYCFEQYLAPPCSKCNAKIKGDCLKAIGKNFHPECFNCIYCGKLFGNSPFFLEDGSPYCEADWNELFTTKCFACGFPVEAGDRWVEALNNNYHSQCFNCTMCKKNLEGQSFFAKGGRPFCKNHAR